MGCAPGFAGGTTHALASDTPTPETSPSPTSRSPPPPPLASPTPLSDRATTVLDCAHINTRRVSRGHFNRVAPRVMRQRFLVGSGRKSRALSGVDVNSESLLVARAQISPKSPSLRLPSPRSRIGTKLQLEVSLNFGDNGTDDDLQLDASADGMHARTWTNPPLHLLACSHDRRQYQSHVLSEVSA
eukprot:NODE_10015_length_1383_cov_1.882962.p1 GENE.NODE_10015_length_1383_cov_1.882962~~NODE_10015_length_1383_cov_1.882962.p1  ORF type:complete len:186 (+),score=31.68 NODE_10015_length_1383_cov_1.882962:725-1282(+)